MTLQSPSETGAGASEALGSPRRRQWRMRDLDLGSFLRRVARALELWSSEGEGAERRRLERIAECCREAVEKRGKMAGLLAVAEVADAYQHLDAPGRDAFFALLRDEFSVAPARVEEAIHAYRQGASDGGTARAEGIVALSRALESPRLALFEQLNTIPSGIKFLVDLRADLHPRFKADASLAPLEYELHRLLEAFFNLGFLHLERITWDSPAALLEKLVEYEAVNRITNWRDLKHRLISDRACYAFLHPAMPCEPVIFVEVALVRGMAESIQTLLDPDAPDLRPDEADTAIFYGISNAQRGLRGIPFGNLLIKKVVTRLRSEVPNLRTFATLSPLPRFRRDFVDAAVADGSIARFYKSGEAERLQEAAGVPDAAGAAEAVGRLLERPDWQRDEAAAEALRPGLMRAARHYLTEVRRDDHAACPVAHFHGANGALLARLNWLGDTSGPGLRQSAGIMANYLYDLEKFEKHQEQYMSAGHIATGRDVRGL